MQHDPVEEPHGFAHVAQVGALGPQQQVECYLAQHRVRGGPLRCWRPFLLKIIDCVGDGVQVHDVTPAGRVPQSSSTKHVVAEQKLGVGVGVAECVYTYTHVRVRVWVWVWLSVCTRTHTYVCVCGRGC